MDKGIVENMKKEISKQGNGEKGSNYRNRNMYKVQMEKNGKIKV